MSAARRHGEAATAWTLRWIACAMRLRDDPEPAVGIVDRYGIRERDPGRILDAARSIRTHATIMRTTAVRMRTGEIRVERDGRGASGVHLVGGGMVGDIVVQPNRGGDMFPGGTSMPEDTATVTSRISRGVIAEETSFSRNAAATVHGEILSPEALESWAEQDDRVADALLDPRAYELGFMTMARMHACSTMASALGGMAGCTDVTVSAPAIRSAHPATRRPLEGPGGWDRARITMIHASSDAEDEEIPLEECLPADMDGPWPPLVALEAMDVDGRMVRTNRAWIHVEPLSDDLEIMRAMAEHDARTRP
jgi:hypothetical protein